MCVAFIAVLVADYLSAYRSLVRVQMKKKLMKVTDKEAVQLLEHAWEKLTDHIQDQVYFWRSQASLAKELSNQDSCSYYTARYKTYMNTLAEIKERLDRVRSKIYEEDGW